MNLEKNAPLSFFGWVDDKNEKSYVLAIPNGLSLLLSGKTDHYVKGLKDFPKSDWPSINQVFQSYHLMVALGMLFFLVSFISLYWHYKKELYQKKWLMKFYVISVVLPVIANQAGWFSAERGRQPWIVQGLLRTSEGFSPNLRPYEIIISLVLFAITYMLLLFSWIYILNKEIQHGPEHNHSIPNSEVEMKFLDAAIDLKKDNHGF